MMSDAANMAQLRSPCQPAGAPLLSLRPGREIDLGPRNSLSIMESSRNINPLGDMSDVGRQRNFAPSAENWQRNSVGDFTKRVRITYPFDN
jgi:hypothetical protein